MIQTIVKLRFKRRHGFVGYFVRRIGKRLSAHYIHLVPFFAIVIIRIRIDDPFIGMMKAGGSVDAN